MNDYSDAPNIVQRFLTYKHISQNRSQKTIHQYYHDLRTFSRFLLINKDKDYYKDTEFNNIPFSDATDELLKSVDTATIYEFISFTSKILDNSPTSRHRKLSCLKSFYKYVTNTVKEMDANPADGVDYPVISKRLPKYLSLEESRELLSSVDGKYYARDYCIVTLFLNCGMRVSELVGINLSDIASDLSSVNVTGKGSKERMIYLNTACKNSIEEYLKVRPTSVKPSDKNALFISRNNSRISVRAVQMLIEKHLKAAGLANRNMSVHKLRHTAATLMYQHGKTDIRVLKDILGHEQLSTTQIYTHINNDMIRDAVNDNPLADIKQTRKAKTAQEINNDE